MKRAVAISLVLVCLFSIVAGCIGVSTSNRPPKATATVSPMTASTFEEMTFTSLGKDSDGSVVKYEWDFEGDGTYDWMSRKAEPVKHEFTKSGKYIAMLKVTDNSGADDIATCAFTITNRAPTATITVSPLNAMSFDAIQFRAFASDIDGSIAMYYWDFDGNGGWDYTSTTTGNTSHTYMRSGTFMPRLRIMDNEGASFEVTTNITINNAAPTVELDTNLNSASTYTEFQFNAVADDTEGAISKYEWDFGSGTFEEGGSTARHSFANDGTYTVTVKVTDAAGASASDSVTVTATNRAPTATAHASSSLVQAFSVVSFTADASDLDGTIVGYAWDFENDGTYDYSGASGSTTHIYQTTGTFVAKLRVTDDDGATSFDTISINVTNSAPIIFASANITSATVLDTIRFTGYGYDPDGTITSYKWDFNGDNVYEFTSSTTGNTTYRYTAKATFNAKLVATDNMGATQTATVTITITNMKPMITLSVSSLAARVGIPLQFHSSGIDADGHVVKYEWDFEGDGTYEWSSPSSGNASHTYATAGTRTARARITDNNGGETSASVTISVTLNNVPTLTSGLVTPTTGTTLDTYSFSVVYTDADNDPPMVMSLIIDAGAVTLSLSVDPSASLALRDGSFTNGEKFIYSTSIPLGTHSYVFNASDGFVYVQTAQATVTVNPPPNTPPGLASVSVTPSTGNTNDVFKFGVIYDDDDDDAPSYIRVQIDTTLYNMLLDTGSSAPFHDGIYSNGEKYYYSTALSAGTHSYKFIASDGTDVAQTSVYNVTVTAANNAPVLSSGQVTPSSGASGSTFTYSVTYADADNNAPLYVRVTIDGTNYDMSKQNAADNVYTDGCNYVYSTNSLSIGSSHTYKFTASDGALSCSLPSSGTYSGPIVTNSAPTLSSGNVTPTSALSGSTFRFMVTYTDANNNAPSYIKVKIDATNYTMVKFNSADSTYTDGCMYTYSTSSLTVGSHTYQYFASDGMVAVQTSQYSGPTVTSPINHAPTLTSGTVTPSSGTTTTQFKYTVIYTDSDNNAPSSVKVIINGTTYTMSKDTSASSYLWDNDYTNGEQYYYFKTFPAGTYNYRFNATDGSLGCNLPTSGTYPGPTVTGSTVNKYAVLVGIEDYPGSYNDLYYCRDDILDWKAYLEARGYSCTCLFDSSATYSAVQSAINTMKSQETASDYCAFIYTGHGIYTSGHSNICLYDYYMPSSDLDTLFTGFDSTHIFFFFDCCNSGEMTTGPLAKSGRFIAAACTTSETTPDGASYPDSHPDGGTDNEDNGLFTYEFLVSLGFTHGNPRIPGPGTTSAETAASTTYSHITGTHSSAGIHPQTYDGYSGTFMF